MSHKLAQLNLPSKAKKAQTLSDIFIAQPDPAKESLAGKLFILIEINKANNDAIKLINFLFQQINNNYYQSDKIILRERISTLKPEHIFETALAKTNKDLEKFIKQEKIKILLSSINITVGLLYEQNFHFANTGKNRIFLFYRQEEEPISSKKYTKTKPKNQYKLADLGLSAKEPTGKQSKTKQFNNVISGLLPLNSFILISNEALPEYITEKKLSTIVSTLPPKSSVEQIKGLLQNINSYISFQSIIIKINKEASEFKPEPAPTNIATKSSTPENISELSSTETTTEKIMSPSGFFNFKKWLNFLNINKIINGTKHITLALLNGVYYIFKFALKAVNLKKSTINIGPKLKFYAQNSKRLLLALNWKKRLLLLTAFLSVIMLTINIITNKKDQEEIAQKKEYRELIVEIEKKQHQAEASLLYSNEKSAQKLFTEITELMEQLPQVSAEQQKTYDEFSTKLELQLEKTNRVIRFEDKERIADFKNINQKASPINLFLLTEAKRLYVADPKNQSVYIVDLNDLSITVAADTSEVTNDLRYPSSAEAESVYYFNANNVIEFRTSDNTIKTLDINLLGDASQFASTDTYNGRYYLLNRKEGQIYRYSRSGKSFSSPYAWIQEAADLSTAIDLSIDGYIYVLQNNGEVIKYLRGRAVDFKLEAVNPAISAPNAIYSSSDLKYIYILEPKESRLIIYDKSGQFLKQYKDNFLKNAKGFAIDENNKQMYFLAGTEILQTSALHLMEEN
ncbi:MAG: hypothetical protein U9Q85_01435 [Patescibacteria group bacterium]|nr:hypothetical protein [Patescibacteria group bacterium]